MTASARTHRDTLAFVLTIVGATAWAAFPLGTVLQQYTDDPAAGLLTVATAGAFLGAWSAATVWRRVALATAAVAGALCGVLVVGALDLNACRRISISARDALMIGGVAAAAAGGASLGRMFRTPRTSLVAAWITISSLALIGLGVAIARSLGYEPDDEGNGLLVLVGGLPGAIIAMILCNGYARRSTAWHLVILSVAGFMIVAFAGPDHEQQRDGALAGGLIGVLLAAHAAIAHWLVHAVSDRWIRPTVPTAKVVDRRP
jgi:hypothetical protein